MNVRVMLLLTPEWQEMLAADGGGQAITRTERQLVVYSRK